MAEQVLELKGKLNGARAVERMMLDAPTKMSSTVRRWLYKERNKFVGSRKGNKIGSFTRSMMRRKHKGTRKNIPPTKWDKRVATMFRGFLKIKNRGDGDLTGTTLRMGLIGKTRRPFVKGILELNKGFTHTSSKSMIVPMHENLLQIGINGKYFSNFRQLAENDDLVPIKQPGGTTLFVYMPMIEEGADVQTATMFIGVHSVTVKAIPFNFEKQWKTRFPKVMQRGQNAIDRTIRGIRRGFVRAK